MKSRIRRGKFLACTKNSSLFDKLGSKNYEFILNARDPHFSGPNAGETGPDNEKVR